MAGVFVSPLRLFLLLPHVGDRRLELGGGENSFPLQ